MMPDLKVDKEMARQKARKLSFNTEPKSESEKMPVLWVSSCNFLLLEHKFENGVMKNRKRYKWKKNSHG